MQKTRNLALLALITTISLLIPAARAQYINPFTGGSWNNPISSTIDTMIFNDIQARTLMLPYDRGEEPTPPPPVSVTSFTPASNFRMAHTLAESLSDDPEVQQALVMLLEHGREEFEAQARAEGKPNNVALALSFFIQANYYVYTGGKEVSDAAQESLWLTLHDILANTPDFTATSNRERQELYEGFLLMATLPLYGYLISLEDGDMQSADLFRTLAGQNLEAAFNVSPDALHFTATGWEINP